MILVEGKTAERKKAKGKCLVYGCNNQARKCKSFCNKHEKESRKEKNPYRYWYGILRLNAKRRKKVFTISLEYFIQFCKETNYINTKGRKSGSMSIDRKIDELGYIEGNLQILEIGENTRKKYTDYGKYLSEFKESPIDISDIFPEKVPIDPDEEVPF
jgi:hypothetical protein